MGLPQKYLLSETSSMILSLRIQQLLCIVEFTFGGGEREKIIELTVYKNNSPFKYERDLN